MVNSKKTLRLSFIIIIALGIISCVHYQYGMQHRNIVPNQYVQVLSTPHDNIQKYLIELIAQEKQGLKIAIFYLSDYSILRALLEARLHNNINIDIIIDPICLTERILPHFYRLIEHGINIYVFENKTFLGNHGGLMHHKFCIFEKNISDESLVWTGSFNFTAMAQKANRENAVILNDVHAIEKLQSTFNYLLEQATPLTKAPRLHNQNKRKLNEKILKKF